MAIRGTTAFAASQEFGLSVLDVTNAGSPVIQGASDVPFKGTHVAVGATANGTVLAVVTGIVTGSSHLWVLNVTNPMSPQVVGELATTLPAGTTVGFLNVAVNDAATLAVVATGTSGLWVIDLSDYTHPAHVGTYATTTAYGVALNATASYVYVADGTGGLKIMSLANPSVPTLAGSLALSGVQRDVAVAGSIVYLADQSYGLRTVDVGTPSSPRLLGTLPTVGIAINVVVGAQASGAMWAIVNEQQNGIPYLAAFDVSAPATPVLLGQAQLDITSSAPIRGLALVGSHAYVAQDLRGFKVYDLGSFALLMTVIDDFAAEHVASTGGVAVATGRYKDGTARLRVVDVTVPKVVGELATTLPYGTTVGFLDVAVNGAGTLAVAAAGTSGLWVIDLSDHTRPAHVGTLATTTAYAVALNATATYAYVADGTGGLKIVSLANPSVPTLAGGLALSGVQRDIAVAGSIVYLADQSYGLRTIDVSSPSSPQLLGTLPTVGIAINVAVGAQASGAMWAIVHEQQNGVPYLAVFDVSAPATPVRLGQAQLDITSSAPIRGLALIGSRAYVAQDLRGFKIYDLTNPASPAMLDTVPMVGNAMGVAVQSSLARLADSRATVSLVYVP